jgi:hypothetical protein
MAEKKQTNEASDPTEEIKEQAKGVWEKLLSLATRKYRIDFEIYGWLLALIVLVLLILIAN